MFVLYVITYCLQKRADIKHNDRATSVRLSVDINIYVVSINKQLREQVLSPKSQIVMTICVANISSSIAHTCR